MKKLVSNAKACRETFDEIAIDLLEMGIESLNEHMAASVD
jgi:hypothetical protein